MKQRTITGLGITALLVLMLFSRSLTPYIFDVFVGAIAVLAAFELSSLLTKGRNFNYGIVIGLAPTMIYVAYILGVHFELPLYYIITIQIIALTIIALFCLLVSFIFEKKIKEEMDARNVRTSFTNYSFQKSMNTFLGMLYPSFLFMLLIIMNHFDTLKYMFNKVEGLEASIGLVALLFAFLIPIFTDTFAYLTGSLFKGKKLCPNISPNKTISGAVGGVFWSMVGAVVVYFVLFSIPSTNSLLISIGLEFWHILILGFVGSIASQAGDIFESYLKRKAGAKDSGNLLPGHGGILDRIDSHIFNAPVVFVFFLIFLLI